MRSKTRRPLLTVHLQDYFMGMLQISSDYSPGSRAELRERTCGKQTATDHQNSVLKEIISLITVCPILIKNKDTKTTIFPGF